MFEDWTTLSPVGPSADFVRRQHQYQCVLDSLRTDPELTGVDIRVIPAAQVLVAVEAQILAGNIPGQDGTEDLYADQLHLTNLGCLVVANTVIATLIGQSTVGYPLNSDFFLDYRAQEIPLNDEVAGIIQQIVWGVVVQEPDSGVIAGDLNHDGFVGVADLNLVLGAWNTSAGLSDPADYDRSGYVGIGDLNAVLGNWNAGTPPGEQTNIPEPSVCLMMIWSWCALAVRRRGLEQFRQE